MEKEKKKKNHMHATTLVTLNTLIFLSIAFKLFSAAYNFKSSTLDEVKIKFALFAG